MRHGEAENIRCFKTSDDANRKLTEKGLLDTSAMGKWLLNSDGYIQSFHVFVSPYCRAQQTATQVLASLKPTISPKCSTIDFITPSADAKAFHDYLDGIISEQEQLNDEENILIISHMPFVSYLVAELTVDSQMPLFSTASIVEIDYDTKSMQGQFIRMVTPEQVK